MVNTGKLATGAPALVGETDPCAPARSCFGRWLGGGLAASVFMFSAFAPVSIDLAAGEFHTSAALAGQGDGNYGNGKGNGGPNGRKPGNGGGSGASNGDDDDGDDDGNDRQVDDDPSTTPEKDEGGGQDNDADTSSGTAEIDFAEALDTADAPVQGAPPTGLPTIGQIFAMGDESALSVEAELEIIANGWNASK